MTKNDRFDAIYDSHVNLVYQYAVVKVKSSDLAKEFVQQVFMNFYEKMDEISEDLIKPWLLLCCKREIIDYFRKTEIKSRSYNPNIRVEDDIVVEDNAERIIEQMVQEELTFHIMECLRRKNESWYEIIEAVGLLEMTQEEAAEHLGISPQVLRAKLYRARKFIRKKYGEEYMNL